MSLGRSYELIGRILAMLVLSGLRGQHLSPKQFEAADRDDFLHFMDVMRWLRNEGLVTTGEPLLNGTFPSVQLTARGIAAVEVGQFDAAAGRSVRETVESKPEGGLPADTYSKIGSFVGGLLGGFTQSVSGG